MYGIIREWFERRAARSAALRRISPSGLWRSVSGVTVRAGTLTATPDPLRHDPAQAVGQRIRLGV